MTMKLNTLFAVGMVMGLTACSTDTYVSKENIDKFGDPQVEKFLIRECIVPERDIRIAMASHFDFDKSELKQQDKASIDQLIQALVNCMVRLRLSAILIIKARMITTLNCHCVGLKR